ncbi:hypothetical protein KSF_002130 [Reticulibacter mediterranei]|uniref:Protein kinase domain-containing protein n=1 Tax=Reticulibacter mediterranei TaxID=2778369 RepID=A0A8J3IG84_9CHLR|nr:protein kinase [Reticulibacter mediterranei]GHO90165.1 hypothetical protein KSF_002130 [Reticulibacter mediterranei]
MSDSESDHTGQQIGNYRIVRMIGRGGFADVYLGKHRYLNSPAALKMLRFSLSDKDAQSFLQEARTLVRLHHPHIVRVLDFAIDNGSPVLITEYVSGGTLRQRHPRGSRLPLYMVVDYVEQIASALQYAHNLHTVHRDVKPENILLDERQSLILSDFGLALFDMPDKRSTQEFGGTLPYMAPEQAHGKSSFASDQYSLAIIAYEWITGTRPFEGTGMQILQQHQMRPPRPLLEHCPDLPVAVEQVVLKALEKDPQKRYASISTFAHALKSACFQRDQHDENSPSTTPLQTVSQFRSVSIPASDPHAPGNTSAMTVFLSAAPGCEATVAYLAADLKQRGIRISNDLLQPGSDQEALRQAVRTTHRVVIVITPQTRSSRLIREHLHLALMYQKKLVLVWMQGKGMAALLLDQIWKPFLPVDVIDARGERYRTAIEELLACLREAHISPFESSTKIQETLPEPRNPYKGLDAFRQSDAVDFFGREALVSEIIQHLGAMLKAEQQGGPGSRLFALVGASGSGKSSAIQAGLLPQLRNGALPGSETWIYAPPIVPGTHPLETLARMLAPQFPDRPVSTVLADLLDDSSHGLHWYAARMVKQSGRRVVFVIDQFEELFTQTISPDEQRIFVDLLAAAATEEHGPALILLTLRADFYDRPMLYPHLYQLMEAHHQSLLPMEVYELRQVIEEPAELADVRVTFEGNLVGDLLFEAQGQVGALPLLEFTLYQLFQRRNQRTLTLTAYQEIGGVKGALIKHAEAVYASLPSEEHRNLVRVLFLRLINPGVTEQDTTRRRATLEELTLPDARQTALLQDVASTFITARLLTASEQAGTTTVEVSHEALIREWARLYNWLRDTREDVRLQQAISKDVEAWEQRRRPKDRLYRGTQLKEAKAWAGRSQPSKQEAAFIRASVGRQRRFVANMGVIFLLLVAAAGTTYWLAIPTLVMNNNDGGPGSLRWAIDRAPAGSTIQFMPNVRGTIQLKSNDLLVSKNLTIQGPGATALAISSGNSGYVVHISDGYVVTISGLSFKESNTAAKAKAGIVANDGTLKLMNVTISGNSSSGSGGGIFNNKGARLTLIDSTVSNNSAQYGGGIYNAGGTLTINRSAIFGNNATGVKGSTAGGILAFGNLSIINSTISDNMASDTAGGIYITGGKATIAFCTIYQNKAQRSGGGLSIDDQGGVAHAEMEDSIVAANNAPIGADILGTLTSRGYNLIQNVSHASLLPGNVVPTDLKGMSPDIGPLKDNGGLTETYALLPGSPAIDKIPSKVCLTIVSTDQRAMKRPQGTACDIGAFEAAPSP